MNIRAITAHEAMLMAREHLAATGWVAPRNEFFRHLPPPPAALWLEQAAATSLAPHSGWTVTSLAGGAPAGIAQRVLDATRTEQRAELFADLVLPGDDAAAPFAWAHRALCTTGVRLRVEAGTAQQPTPLELRHQPTNQVEAPLLVIELAEGAHCILRELHLAGDATAPGGKVQNLQLHVRLGRGASLQHLRVIAPHADDHCAHVVHAQIGAHARYVQAFVAGGSSYHLQRSQVFLSGPGASAHIAGLTCAADTQFEQQILMRHAAVRTTSHSEALVLASGKAHAVANASTHIAAGSDEADVRQRLTGIPLGGQPRLVLRPHLEIYHDNVQAAHGATWGALPEEALFYARQRGLDEPAARALIVEGMANALLSRAFTAPATLDALAQGDALQGVLRQGLEACHG